VSSRIYIVNMKGVKPKLVDAITQAQAIRHVARGLISAKVATARETAMLMGQGIQLEIAGEQDVEDESAEA
jgi:hypothetical protein